MNEEYKIEGEFDSENDVIVSVVKSIPQPDKVDEFFYTIGAIKKAIEDIDLSIENNLKEKQRWLDILEKTSKEVKKSVKATVNNGRKSD